MVKETLAACSLLLLGASAAPAQTPTKDDRVFVNINFGAQRQSKSPDETIHLGLPLYFETASVDATRPTLKGGSFVDVTAGSFPLHHVGVAVNFMRRSESANGVLTASIPDPAYYDSPQTLSGGISAMEHRETWVALLLVYRLSATPKVDVTLMAGPSVARVEHEAVTSVSVDTATGQVSASLENVARDLLGGQVGVDVRYMLVRQIGIGGYIRYNAAKGNLAPTLKADLGGPQLGGGVRIRF